MGFLLTTLEFLAALILIVLFGLVSVIVFEAYRRRHNNAHLEEPAIFEDPKSLKQVPCPYIFNPAEKYLSLIIPAFNEEHRLPSALNETMNYLQQRAAKDKSFSYEVLIVDDGSRDGTKRVAFDFVKKYGVDNVRAILLGKNHGKGEAIRKGMLHSRGELLLMLDADGATKVTDLEKLENQIHEVARKDHHPGDSAASDTSFRVSDVPIVAFGSRAHLEEKALATRKWYRNFLMKGFHLVVVLTAGPGIRDTQCGFKMFTRSAARKLFTNIRLKRWCFDVELVFLCKWFSIPMLEISVNWSEIPGSKACLILHSNFQNNRFAEMGSLVFHEFKRQASFFFKEKIKTARLALTDVTPVELLTEEATNGNMLSPNASSMGAISRAAFEVDDYWRIVDILHKRLEKFDTKNWRASYNALVLLEHLLTHGPLRVAEEFQNDKDSIKEMENFQYIDEKRFNWGLSVRKLSEKILMLLENESFLKEERARARKLTMMIKGFGSFSHFSSSMDESFNSFSNYGRLNSQFYDHQNHEEDYFLEFKETFPSKEGIRKTEENNYNQNKLVPRKIEINGDQSLERSGDGDNIEREHPFCEDDQQETAESLLYAIM